MKMFISAAGSLDLIYPPKKIIFPAKIFQVVVDSMELQIILD
jgi:hypothetical protein